MSPSSERRAARIGIVLHDFPAGGTERIAIRLANAWAEAGRAVTIFAGSAAGPALALVAPGVAIAAADPPIPRGRGSRFRLGRRLAGMIAERGVDALVCPGNFHLPVIRAARRLPCAVIAKLSNPLRGRDRNALHRGGFALVMRLVARRIDRFVAMSPALATEARALLATPVTVVDEPILAAPSAPHRRRAGGAPLILCAGRLVAQKDFALALAAFARLQRPAARIVVLGDGPERGPLERLATRLGIAGRVEFAGHVADIAPWLARADLLLLSSRFEGYPAVLVEALAAGVPVVATRCSPAIDEILADPSFGRVAASTPEALAVAIESVLSADGVAEAPRAALALRHAAAASAACWLAVLDDAVAGR